MKSSLPYKNSRTSATCHSIDYNPWKHPYLTEHNLKRVRDYSQQVWEYALAYEKTMSAPLDIGFTINMAQNTYKWASLSQQFGARVKLYLHPHDQTALSQPEWEEFDGEFSDLFDANNFLRAHPNLVPRVTCETVPMDDMGLMAASQEFMLGNRKPLLQLLRRFPNLYHEAFLTWNAVHPYLAWSGALSHHDVLFTASSAIAAYLSGRPYCAQSVGGDLQFDCGRSDDFGRISALSFNHARFITFTNPDKIAHCRRLGFTSGLYLPYPMDLDRYRPGRSQSRTEWEARFGKGVYFLCTARIDNGVKGNGDAIFQTLAKAAAVRPSLRFVFLNWGENAKDFQARVEQSGLTEQFIILSPVGKTRLIDYYRACDVVLDQFVFGYYGATGLEAAAIGKPIVMRIREEHYRPLYQGDVAPVENVQDSSDLYHSIIRLVDDCRYRDNRGRQMRKWLVRTHSEKRMIPILLAILRLTAHHKQLPDDLICPLLDSENQAEIDYHDECVLSDHVAA